MENYQHPRPSIRSERLIDTNLDGDRQNERKAINPLLPLIKRPIVRSSNEESTYFSDIIRTSSVLNIRSTQPRNRRYNVSFKDRIVINVSGDRFETQRKTLEVYPNTLLGNSDRRKYFYDKQRNEYFFDRSRSCFEAILFYYQSNGQLRRPNYVPIDIFLEEVAFFELGDEALNQLRKDENIQEVKKVLLPKGRIRRCIWATMEYPDYSLLAKFVNIVSLVMILVSTISLAIESLPSFSDLDDFGCQVKTIDNQTNSTNVSLNLTEKQIAQQDDKYSCRLQLGSPFFIVQAVCMAFFTIELFLRLFSTPSISKFLKNIMNWVDILAVIPFYVILIIRFTVKSNEIDVDGYMGLRLLRILRFLRVFKLYQVLKGVKSLRVLAATLRESVPDFFMMIFILTLLGFLFGAAAFLAENETNRESFDSIFKATYWGVITITSVGYGDIYPTTPIGRLISCLCALFGAATIAILVSVLVDRYQRVYARRLYVQEELIDFDGFSDDEMNNENDSKTSRHSSFAQTLNDENGENSRKISNESELLVKKSANNENREIDSTTDEDRRISKNIFNKNE